MTTLFTLWIVTPYLRKVTICFLNKRGLYLGYTGRTLFLFVAAVLLLTPRGQVFASQKNPFSSLAPEVTFSFVPNIGRASYDVHVFWNDFPNTGFVLALNDYEYSDPDSLVTTYGNSYTFFNVSPGPHYVHMKVGLDERWSAPYHWQINVPARYSTSPSGVLGTSSQRHCWWFVCW